MWPVLLDLFTTAPITSHQPHLPIHVLSSGHVCAGVYPTGTHCTVPRTDDLPFSCRSHSSVLTGSLLCGVPPACHFRTPNKLGSSLLYAKCEVRVVGYTPSWDPAQTLSSIIRLPSLIGIAITRYGLGKQPVQRGNGEEKEGGESAEGRRRGGGRTLAGTWKRLLVGCWEEKSISLLE